MHINCQFNLSRPSAVYYTGEQVSGSCSLTVGKKKPLQLETLSITLLGRSTTSWQEAQQCLPQIEHNDSTAGSEKLQVNYVADKLHLQQSQQLLQTFILPAGCTESFSFEFELPSSLPGSCRLPLGSTSYMLQVCLQRRGKHDKCFQQRLYIRNRIEFIELQPAINATATLRLSLPRSVFAPGQRVAYRLESTEPASCVTRLYQSISYQSQQPCSKLKQVLRVLDESCDLEATLHLPLTVPIMSQLPDEPIEITYFLETLSSCSELLRLPLFVGTVAPPVEVFDCPKDYPSLGFSNFALCENDLLFPPLNQRLPHSCSRELSTPSSTRQCEHLKLLRRQKKKSYVRLAMQYLYRSLLPAN